MSQRKSKRWWGIRKKVFEGLLVTAILGCVALTYSVNRQINSNNEMQIRKDVDVLRDTTTMHVKQTIMLRIERYNEYGFNQASYAILSDLDNEGRRYIALYDNEGTLLVSSKKSLFVVNKKATTSDKSIITGNHGNDLKNALQGKASYTIDRDNKDKLILYLSIPIKINEKQAGIVRYYIDYTDLLLMGRENTSTVLKITIGIFVLVFVLITFIIQMILSPIRQLAGISNQVTDDLNAGKYDESFYFSLAPSSRKDELGDLTNNYRIMVNTVQTQLEKLKKDKNQIYELMENRKEFYDNVTHELKTPLTTISGYAQLLQDNGIEDKDLFQNGVQNILAESERLHKMVIQLLEMSTKDSQQIWETIELNQILRDVSEAMELKAKRYDSHIEFINIVPIKITVLKDRVREVFVNIIDNAIKYGTNPQTIQISLSKKIEWIEIAITNEGKPNTEEDFSHIFEPFYRVDKQASREQGSAGLGLSICKQIMKEHGGSIRVSSKKGMTCFIIRFPSK